jgi:predicted phage terminase large subunit-like protein
MGPRHGKSFTIQNLCDFHLGNNPEAHIMVGTYNEKLSTKFAKTVRNTILTAKTSNDEIVYNDIFPDVKIQRGSAAANLWALEGSYDSFLATSPTGTSTGFGASLLVIDDIIKDKYEAFNESILEDHWDWFNNTMMSRLEEGGKIIIIATRWNSNDLSGRIIEEYGDRVRTLTMKSCIDEKKGIMLCSELLSFKKYKEKISKMDARVAAANYQQICIDEESRVYKNLKTYSYQEFTKNKKGFEIYSYCDTADEGADYLCNIIWAWNFAERKAYILDVYYTQDPMEITEKEVAKRLTKYGVNLARVESNNGGRGFARNVIRIMQEDEKNFKTITKWFHQGNNKLARIRSNASQVMEFVYFPDDWQLLWPKFYMDINRFDSQGGNLHDDCADALTGVIETMIIHNGI